MVAEESSDIAVKEFLFAGQQLATFYGLELEYKYAPTPRLPPEPLGITVRAAIPYNYTLTRSSDYAEWARDRFAAREWFIRSGHHASQIICRNYLSGLRDRNEYFEFLQKEFNTATSLAQILLTLTSVSEKAKDIFTQVVNSANLGADAYQSFKFLTPEIETILPLVEAAQVAMRDYYLSKEGLPATFAGALNAVSKIEYQCTRSGIRSILNKTLVQAKPQYKVVNGTLYSTEAKDPDPKTPVKPTNLPKEKEPTAVEKAIGK